MTRPARPEIGRGAHKKPLIQTRGRGRFRSLPHAFALPRSIAATVAASAALRAATLGYFGDFPCPVLPWMQCGENAASPPCVPRWKRPTMRIHHIRTVTAATTRINHACARAIPTVANGQVLEGCLALISQQWSHRTGSPRRPGRRPWLWGDRPERFRVQVRIHRFRPKFGKNGGGMLSRASRVYLKSGAGCSKEGRVGAVKSPRTSAISYMRRTVLSVEGRGVRLVGSKRPFDLVIALQDVLFHPLASEDGKTWSS